MNERIKELAEQAWNDTAVSPDFGHPVSFAEKFAELIVKECMTFFDNNKQVMNVKSPLATPSTMLKIYWGIENET